METRTCFHKNCQNQITCFDIESQLGSCEDHQELWNELLVQREASENLSNLLAGIRQKENPVEVFQ